MPRRSKSNLNRISNLKKGKTAQSLLDVQKPNPITTIQTVFSTVQRNLTPILLDNNVIVPDSAPKLSNKGHRANESIFENLSHFL